MPLYEYQCEDCGVRFEVIQRFSDAPVEKCRSCGGPVRRLLSAPAIQFKGSGWYITDYGRKGKGDSATVSHDSPSNSDKSSSSSSSSSSSESASSSSSTTPTTGGDGGTKKG